MFNLKILRKQHNIKQLDMAKKFNMSLRGYQSIENHINETSYENLIKFANYFGCSIDYLLGHETKNLIHADNLSHEKSELIKKIIAMDESDIGIVNGILLRLEDERRNPWMKG